MSLLNRLLEQLEKRGLKVMPGDKPGELILCGNTKEATPEVMKALKQFKPKLIEKFGGASHKKQVETIREEAANEGLIEGDPEDD